MERVRPHKVTVAETLEPVIRHLFRGALPTVGLSFWDGSRLGPDGGSARLVVRSPDALRRILFAPGELGFGRAYVAGEIDVEGDIYQALDLRSLMGGDRDLVEVKLDAEGVRLLARAARTLGVFGKPLPPPLEEAKLTGRMHQRERDAAAVSHHYNVGNRFYQVVLGPTMAYSCAYFAGPSFADPKLTLDEAQTAKFELICRKLALEPGQRMLDIGCGWGSMLIHAARHHGVRGVGVTIAREQAELARERVAEAGLSDRIEIRLQDYRDVTDGPFDAISSIGMFEHVGREQMLSYFKGVHAQLKPGGRLLNHAISTLDNRHGRVPKRSFIGRYVFPDGELMEVGEVVTALQGLGLEVRDVESLREHYGLTLRAWVANLEASWDRVCDEVGERRARVWRLYMAASAINFEANRTAIHQVIAVKTPETGRSGVAPTRAYLRLDEPLPTTALARS